MSPAWAWLALALGVIAYVVGYDLWAIATSHHTLSRQMHDWIFSPLIAPFVLGGFAALFVGLLVHFVVYHGSQ